MEGCSDRHKIFQWNFPVVSIEDGSFSWVGFESVWTDLVCDLSSRKSPKSAAFLPGLLGILEWRKKARAVPRQALLFLSWRRKFAPQGREKPRPQEASKPARSSARPILPGTCTIFWLTDLTDRQKKRVRIARPGAVWFWSGAQNLCTCAKERESLGLRARRWKSDGKKLASSPFPEW